MGRRRNDELFWLQPIMGIVGAIMLFCMINPNFRNVLLGFCALVIWGICILVAIGIGFLIYRMIKHGRDIQPNTSSAHIGSASPVHLSIPKPELTDFEKYGPKSKPLPTVYCPPPEPEIKPIDRLRKIDWYQFEKFVAWVYENRGFRVTKKGGAKPDGGIDLIIEKDGQKKAVQCKHWKGRDVGVKAVREFLGALTDAQIPKGIFITLNGYTADAKQLAEKRGIEIINETGLCSMLTGLDLRDPEVLQILNDTRKFCPKCEREMVLWTAVKGPNPGEQFWGCKGYPRCKFIMAC
jgi:hypothetical protein